MKKLFYIFTVLVLSSVVAQAQNPVKKILFEEFTGTWCGACPDGTLEMESIRTANQSNCITASWHHNDPMSIPECAALEAALHSNIYPQASIDRNKYAGNPNLTFTKPYWANNFNTRKTSTAIVSVSFVNPHFDGTQYKATVTMKFVSAPAAGVSLKMNVLLTEDSIFGTGALEQHNYLPNIENGADPLTHWYHNETIRKALSGTWGFSCFPGNIVVGTVYSQEIYFTPDPAWHLNQMNAIAYVAYDGDTLNNRKEILNTEQLRLTGWPLGINENRGQNLISSVYPNPLKNAGKLKVSFTLKQDAQVSMEVSNATGQLVSLPYSSFEISGAHTIQWSPSENGSKLAPGIYFVKLRTDKGDQQTSQFVLE